MKPVKPLRTVLLYSAGHLGSASILNNLMEYPEFEIVGIVKAKTIPMSRKGADKLRKHLRKVGWRFGWLLLWQQILQGVGFALTSVIPFLKNRLSPAWILARTHNIPVLFCRNINSKRSVSFIREHEPDVIISAYFNQILKSTVISIPKQGVLNVHPGWLPAYRGAMCYFWVLKNGEEKAGVSVHWIDEGIDTGEVLARKSFLIRKGDTQLQVLIRTAEIGARLLKLIGRRLQHGKQVKPLPEPETPPAYYPMPGSTDFDNYFRGRRFFRIRNLFSFLFRQRK